MNGKLYVVATPIGNLGDITKRAVEVLSGVKYIAAEDTRETRGLLLKLGIPADKTYFTNNGYNENSSKNKITDVLLAGNDVALVSDAGMPGISDPGAILVDKAAENGIEVTGVCGASAVITAVALSGFVKSNSDFAFFGFLPRKKGEIEEKIDFAVNSGISTAVFYESPLRIIASFEIFASKIPNAKVCLCNDLTKLYEKIYRGTAASVLEQLKENAKAQKGEYAVVIDLSNEKPDKKAENEGALSPEAYLVDYMLKSDTDLRDAVKNASEEKIFTKNQLKNASFRLKEMFGDANSGYKKEPKK